MIFFKPRLSHWLISRGANINIFSDSQAAVKSLDSFALQSSLVWEGLKILETLPARNFATRMWVPGHEGHEGNEIADTLAKRVYNRQERGLIECWRAQTGIRQSKRLIDPEPINVEAILNLSRKDIKLYSELLRTSGHCKLNYHTKKSGVAENDS